MTQPSLEQFAYEVVARLGFPEAGISADPEGRRGAVTIAGLELETRQLQEFVEALNQVVARYADKQKLPAVFFDVNGYRAEREKLIERLALAAAEKVKVSGQPLELPSMNSYERRLVHGRIGELEGVTSESVGLGKERRVTIRRAG